MATESWRAEYIGDCDEPASGAVGTAQIADGFYDETSAQCGAFTFSPDGDPDKSYYVAEGDLRFLS